MFFLDYMKINERNHLEIGGCDTVELAEQYGTPLYVMDEERIRANARRYRNAVEEFYGGNGLVLYASKALCTAALYRIIDEEGLGADVVSGGELYTALKADFDPKKIYFHGNNKTRAELEMAVDAGVGRIVVDNAYELAMLDEISASRGTVSEILFRLKPGVEAHTHEFISTGQIDSKFGAALETNEAFHLVEQACACKHIRLIGIHCHIGSQIFDLEPFKLAADVMLEFAREIKEKLGVVIKELNLGGGFGIQYTAEDKPLPYHQYMMAVSEVVKTSCAEKGLEFPFILMEPGRSIVGDAGITLYTVGAVKEIPNIRKYASVDGGMGDNPRYLLYEAQYDGVLANRANAPVDDVVTVCGKCCESGDILIRDANLPAMVPGDILAVMSTGAYNYSMSSNYNRIPRPPVVLVKNGTSRVIVKRETYEQVMQNDVF
ncbi:MAG: diaminopimelate decarboxylase [Ruminococcaceae bacterium]|nr:diaminopimelate decarboxylase [Oscillospiraceae bacterium]